MAANSDETTHRIKSTFQLAPQDVQRLKFLANEQGITVTHSLRRAIATEEAIYNYFREGSKILVQTPDGEVKELEYHHQYNGGKTSES